MIQKSLSPEKQKTLNWIMVSVVVVCVGGIAILFFLQCDSAGCPTIEEFVRGFGVWAPVFFGLTYIASSPIPFLAPLLSAAGGLIFGPVTGTLLVLFFATLSALVPFFLARLLGQEWVASKLKGKNFDQLYQQSEGRGGFLFVLLMRLIPILPWEIQNYVGGLSKVTVPTFMVATVLGIIPGSFSIVFLGSSIRDPGSWQFYLAIGLNLVIILIPVIAIYLKRRKKKGVPGGQA